MRLRFVIPVVAALSLGAASADAATIYTFSISGDADYDTSSIHSFSFDPVGTGGTLTFLKDIDASSTHIASATAAGTTFAGATFVAYDGAVAPEQELFRYTFSGNVLFASYSWSGVTDLVGVSAETITRTEGPASIPEPASGLLILAGALSLLVRRVKSTRRRPSRGPMR